MKNQTQQIWSTTPATSERIVDAISRIHTVLRAGVWQFATSEGLNPTQVDILGLLRTREQGMRLSWVAEQLGVTTASTSDSIASLTAKGLVEKGRAVDDGRAIALKLTPDGRILAGKIAGAMHFAFDAIESLPECSQQQMFAGLLDLIGVLQQADRFPAIRACLSCQHFAAHVHHDAAAPHHCRLVNAALPAALLRLDCPEHSAADQAVTAQNWKILRRA